MGIIAEFTIEEEEFSLGSVLADGPDMVVELDRIAPRAAHGIPYLWVTGDDHEGFERALRRSSLITSFTAVDRINDDVLYRMEWEPEAESLLQEVAEANASVLEAYREDDSWFFRIRFDEHEDLSRFNEHCSESNIHFHLIRVYSDSHSHAQTTVFGLSHQQHDALVLALERGYFDVPRRTTLSDLGNELGISQQAASERVRRAAGTVLRTVLLSPETDGEGISAR